MDPSILIPSIGGALLAEAAKSTGPAERVELLARAWAATYVALKGIRELRVPGRITGEAADDARKWLDTLEDVLFGPLPVFVAKLIDDDLRRRFPGVK